MRGLLLDLCPTFVFAGLLAVPAGCAKDPIDTSDAGVDGGTDAGETGADDAGVDDRVPAHGVRIADVYANQAVRVRVANGADAILTDRTAPLVKGKKTLLRGMLEVEEGWEPREIEVEIRLVYEDGTEEAQSLSLMVNGDSEDGDPSSSIFAPIPGELIRPGMKFQLRMFDQDDSREGEALFGPVDSPSEPGLLGIQPEDLGIDVTLVPIYHDLGDDCPETPAPTENDVALLSEWLLAHNPADHVDITIAPALTFSQTVSNGFDLLLNFLAQAREDAGADPGAYWYGLIRTCGETPMVPGVGAIDGQAIAINDINFVDDPSLRVAAGRWRTDVLTDGIVQVEKSVMDTFVHEIGHTQGRAHSPCEAPGADNNYPYPDADIGVWGFDTVNNLYFSPTARKDYMSYCNPVWVSDYVYLAVYPFIRTISGWESGKQATPGGVAQPLLYGQVDPNGEVSWRTRMGVMPAHHEAHVTVEIDGVPMDAAFLAPTEAERGGLLIAPLPATWTSGNDAAIQAGAGTLVVELDGEPRTFAREVLRASVAATRKGAVDALRVRTP